MDNKLIIEQTAKTPYIFFDPQKGIFEIRGRSIIENTTKFYEPILKNWIEPYLDNPQETTIINIALDYYNTSSQMWVFQIVKAILKLRAKEKDVKINWYYVDEDMFEAGEDFALVLKYPVTYIKVDNIF